MSVEIIIGDALTELRKLPGDSVDCVVTSPPYWGGLRNYDNDRQLGMEPDPTDYVAALVTVFDEVRRVLKADGALWLNIGDSYAASGKGGGGNRGDRKAWSTIARRSGFRTAPEGFKPKDVVLTSFMVAEALRQAGWYLRKTVVWEKPAAIEPERLDRPSLSHEYIFLLTKSEHYAARNPGELWWHHSVWRIQPQGHEGHPAAFPPELVRRCIVASCQKGATILDPFAGAGTTGIVADGLHRNAILIELNSEFADLARLRLTTGRGALLDAMEAA